MKKTSILKLVLAAGAFVLLSPMISDAWISDPKDRAACEKCQESWFHRPYDNCTKTCLAASKKKKARSACYKKCDATAHSDKDKAMFKKCVTNPRGVSLKNQANCPFDEIDNGAI